MQFWTKWLIYANILFVIIGFIVAFAGNSIFFHWHNEATKDLFFDGTAIPENILLLKNWLFGIIGGTIAGYHLLMVYIAKYAFSERQQWAWCSLLWSLLLWFFIDSGISFYYGAYYNVYLINIFALIGIGIPLAATRKFFFS